MAVFNFKQWKNVLLLTVFLTTCYFVGIVLATLGTVFSDKVEEFFGVEDDTAVTVEQKQEVNVEGPTINVIIPEQKKDTVVKKVYIKPKPKLSETEKRKKNGLDW